jgi:hypothetical protein
MRYQEGGIPRPRNAPIKRVVSKSSSANAGTERPFYELYKFLS